MHDFIQSNAIISRSTQYNVEVSFEKKLRRYIFLYFFIFFYIFLYFFIFFYIFLYFFIFFYIFLYFFISKRHVFDSRINCVEKLVKQCKIKWGTIECSSHFLLESTPYNAVFYKEQKNERLCL